MFQPYPCCLEISGQHQDVVRQQNPHQNAAGRAGEFYLPAELCSMNSHWGLLAGSLALTGLALAQPTKTLPIPAPVGRVDYNRDIRPILSGKCFACHGQDENKRVAGLRLDLPNHAVVGGDILASALSLRIGATGALQMPAADSGKTLTESEKTLLRRWIGQGGKYQQHWAFAPLMRPSPPTLSHYWEGVARNEPGEGNRCLHHRAACQREADALAGGG